MKYMVNCHTYEGFGGETTDGANFTERRVE